MFEVRVYKKNDKFFVILGANLGYAFKWLTLKNQDIAEICCLSVRDLMDRAENAEHNEVIYTFD